MEDFGNFHNQDVTDVLLDETETELHLGEFEVICQNLSGPKCPIILNLHQEWLKNKKMLEKESAVVLDENPEAVKIREIEREIKRQLSMFENRLNYSSKLPVKKPLSFEDEDITMSKQLPVFLGREYFKYQSDSDASSTQTDSTELEDGATGVTTFASVTPVPPNPFKGPYFNFTYNNFNYSFPFYN